MPSAATSAAAAWANGLFDDELVRLGPAERSMHLVSSTYDEGYRADATMETLGKLRALEGGVVTKATPANRMTPPPRGLVVAEDKLDEPGHPHVRHQPGCRSRGSQPHGHRPIPAVENGWLFARNGPGYKRHRPVELNKPAPGARRAQGLGLARRRQPERNQRRTAGHLVGHPIGAGRRKYSGQSDAGTVLQECRYGLKSMYWRRPGRRDLERAA